jgi:hypothetical protein
MNTNIALSQEEHTIEHLEKRIKVLERKLKKEHQQKTIAYAFIVDKEMFAEFTRYLRTDAHHDIQDKMKYISESYINL